MAFAGDSGNLGQVFSESRGQHVKTLQLNQLGSFLGHCAGSLSIAGAAVLIMFSNDLQRLLQFDREMFANGQWWRAITGHLTHWNFDHLFWDLFAFVVTGILCERLNRRAWGICIFGSVVLVSAVIFWKQPSMTVYRGLSGVDSGLFAMALTWMIVAWIGRREYLLGIAGVVGAILFLCKLIYEVATGRILFVDSDAGGFRPAIEAHLAGAVVGILVAVLFALRGWQARAMMFRPFQPSIELKERK